MAVQRLEAGRTVVLVVDMQERLLPVIKDSEQVVRQNQRLLDGAAALEMPVLVTEQYPQGLGQTVAEIAQKLPETAERHEKLKFSACIEPIREQLLRLQARCVIVAGVEAHVCVLQTCLDLVEAGYVTAVAVDAIGSRKQTDLEPAVRRMEQAGVLPVTVESALLELVREAGGQRFKAILPVVKA